jgi:Phosphatidylserine/phosphatidylglycerophosphate/cardiolipin synthases and related enzymes
VFKPIIAIALVAGVCAGGDPTADTPQIVELYPNSVAEGTAGEFVTVTVPANTTLSEYSLTDETARGELSTTNRSGRHQVTFAATPKLTRALTDRTVRPLPDGIRLADDGDRVRLLRAGTLIHSVAYDGPATEGDVYNTQANEWHPLGATDRAVTGTTANRAELFVLPDAADRAQSLLTRADTRILLGGYTLTSTAIVDRLVAAHQRGVCVRVLVEGGPVGGLPASGAAALDRLEQAGIDVRVLAGDRARYRYHHAKYAVVDDQAFVTTENWKPTGVGGRANRGWGVIVRNRAVVNELVGVFNHDTSWVDAIEWSDADPTVVESDQRTDDYPSVFSNKTVAIERVELLVAPDNAADRITELIATVDHRLAVLQPTVSDRGFPFVDAVIDAAERGVTVRVLLSNAWYVEEHNRRLAAWLRDQASARGLDLAVRVADPDGAFDTVHAKGLIADNQVIVGSINWSNNSIRHNREVAVVLHGKAAAEYYHSVFTTDWADGTDQIVPAGLLAAAVVAAVIAAGVARRIQFRSETK